MKLKGKIAIVTGAAGGMGSDIAIEFVKQGAKLTVTDLQRKGLVETEESITASGGECIGILADLSQLSQIEEVVQKTINKFGKLDILVNCAGIWEPCNFLEVTEEYYDQMLKVNLKSVFFMSQRAAIEMKKQGKGKIISIASVGGGIIGFPQGSVYCASKGGIVSLIQTMALELAPHKINVNAISPGNIRTPIAKDRYNDPNYIKAIGDMTPLGRIGETSDITPAAVYLASEDSDYVTGIQLAIDGGVTCGMQLAKVKISE